MKKSIVLVMASVGLAALAAPAAFATPTMVVTVGSSHQNVTLTSAAAILGAGTYIAAPGSFDGFSYGGVVVSTSGYTLQTQFSGVTDTTSGSADISFAVTNDYSTGGNSTNFRSMQTSGSATATNASSSQTIDFNGMVSPGGGSSTSQDSGALPLNSPTPVLPSSSTSYDLAGVNLNTPSSSVSVTNTWTVSLSSVSMVNGGIMVTNLSTSSVVTPEPAALALLGLGGAVALLGLRRRAAVEVK